MTINATSSYGANVLNAYTQSTSGTSSDSSSSSSSNSSTSSSSTNGYSNTAGSALARFQAQMQLQIINQYQGYSQLQSTLGSFQNMMIGVMTSAFGSLTSGVKVSDGTVGYLSPSQDTSYSVNVSQLAQSQTVTSGADFGTSSSSALFKGGTLTIQTGAYSSGGTFTGSGNPVSVTVGANASLQNVVDAINAAKAGVTASVAKDSGTGKVHLKLVGNNSGDASAFAISTTDTGAGTNSLGTLAYNGTNKTNYPAQTLTSSTDYGTDSTATTFKSGTLSIQMGSTGPSGTFTTSGNPISVAIADNSSMDSIAAAITAANAGVTASVVTDQTTNKVHLQIVGSGSNAGSTFTITGSTTSAYAGTGTNGLEGLNYASGNTGNYTASTVQAAQDAKYTVNGNPFQSPSNLSVPVAAGINLNLLKTGSTVVSIPGSPTAVTNTANSLVSTVNGLLQVLQQMTGSNGLLASDPTVSTQLTNDLALTMNGSFNASKYTQSLAAIGVTRQSDGTYAVNTTTLDQAFSTDSSGVQNILSMAASSLMNMMSNYISKDGTITAKINALQYQLPADNSTGNLSNYTSNTPTQQQAANAYTMLSTLYGSGVNSLFG